MNMGGAGMMLRTVARVAGPAAGANPAVTCGGASAAFCSACGDANQVAHHSVRSSSCHHVTLLQQQEQNSGEGHSHQVSEFEEDWEFAEMSAANHQPKVDAPSSSSSSVAEDINPLAFASGSCGWPYPFGMPPSFEEAQEATFELEKAMADYSTHVLDTSDAVSGSPSPTESSCGGNNLISRASDWIEPRYMPEWGSAQGPRHPVHQALHLLRHDPCVKDTVISIVSDADVWHAMMKNKKVQELKRLLQGSSKEEPIVVSEAEVEEEMLSRGKHDWMSEVADVVYSIISTSKKIAFKVQDVICRVLMSIYGVSSRGWGPTLKDASPEDDPIERTLKSSMALAMLVFAIVILKRFHA